MDFIDYQKSPAINQSKLKKLLDSAKHFHAAMCGQIKDDETKRQRLGKAVHSRILTPDLFRETWITHPKTYGGDGRPWHNGAHACKRWIADKRAEGKQVLSEDQLATVVGIADSIARTPELAELFKEGLAEHALFWTDEDSGLPCKALLDFLPKPRLAILDIKSTERPIDKRGMQKVFLDNLIQPGFYWLAAKANGINVEEFIFIAAETTEPWDVCPYKVGGKSLEHSVKTVKELLMQAKLCSATGVYPGRYVSGDFPEVELPDWVFREGGGDLWD